MIHPISRSIRTSRLVLVALVALGANVSGSEPVAWDRLDRSIDRSLLVSRYLFHDRQPDDPWADYAATLGADATPLADLRAEFADLDATTRASRREEAAALLSRGRLAVLDRVVPLRDLTADGAYSLVGDPGEPTPGFGEAVTTAIGRFAAAVRRDPALAEAWYHLAYFCDVAGDRARARRARSAFFAVWSDLEAGERERLAPLRQAAVLDRAWSLREAGEYARCLAWLDEHAGALPGAAEGLNVPPAVEARLVRALAHAEQGQVGAALAHLPHLPLMAVAHGAAAPLRTYLPVGNQRAIHARRFHADDMESPPAATDVWRESLQDDLSRERRQSSYLRRWVKAWTSLRRGHDPRTVRRELGRLETEVEFPPRLAWRWWQDQGVLHELLGDHDLARVCWARAAVYRPYFIFHPTGQGRGLTRVHDLPGTGQPFFLAYGTFFMTGSPWSYAASAALASEVETGALERTILRRVARERLDACVRRRLRPDAARALRGRLAFLEGDYAAAATDLGAAWDALAARDAAPADLALMRGLCEFNREDWAAALPWLEVFTTRQPDAHVGWLARGLAEAKLGREETAVATLDRAVALAPDDATCLYNRGLVRYRLGRREEARADFLAAAAQWPQNTQIARMVRVAAEETRYDLDVAVSPVRLDLPADQRERLAGLLRQGRDDGAAGELGGLVSATPAQRERMLETLTRRYADDPTPRNRMQLARAALLVGDGERVQQLLAPEWPGGLSPVERRLLLYADRERGVSSRAVELASTAGWEGQDVDLELLVLTVTILLDHDRRELARGLVARGLAVAPQSAILEDVRRSLERRP